MAHTRGFFVLTVAVGVLAISACGGSGSTRSEATQTSGGQTTVEPGGQSLGAHGVVTVGIVNPYSGPAAFYGQALTGVYKTMHVIIKESGGIKVHGDTYQLAYKEYDDKLDPTVAVNVMRRAILQDGIRIVDICCEVGPAVQPLADENKVLMLTLDSVGGEDLGPAHPLNFFNYYQASDSLAVTLEYLKSAKPELKTIALLQPEGAVGKILGEQDQKNVSKLGITQKSLDLISQDVADFTPLMTKVLRSNPDLISVGYLPPGQWPLVVRSARSLGFKGTFIFPDQLLASVVSKTLDPKDVEGSYAAPIFQVPPGECQQYMDLLSKKMGFPVDPYILLWHDTIRLLQKAIETTNSLDTVQVANALGKISIKGCTSPDFRFGGANRVGLNRQLKFPIKVGEIGPKFSLKQVYEALPPGLK